MCICVAMSVEANLPSVYNYITSLYKADLNGNSHQLQTYKTYHLQTTYIPPTHHLHTIYHGSRSNLATVHMGCEFA